MIIFSKPLNNNRLRLAYNNDIVEFYSSEPDAIYADVTYNGITNRYYPNPLGRFVFNFKPYITSIINTREFKDTTVTDFQTPDPDSFVYNNAPGTLLNMNVTFTITFENESTESTTQNLTWILGVEQISEFVEKTTEDVKILSPYKLDTTNNWYLKYWEGYPFDFSLYLEDTTAILKNNTNLQEAEFNLDGFITRFFLSDGRTTETIEDVLPLSDGFNQLEIFDSSLQSTDNFITLEKVDFTCGVYFKWFNNQGGYSYWLFEDTAAITRKTKSTGEVMKDFTNLEYADTRSYNLGQESSDTVRVVAELLNKEERNIIKSILDSPKIYIFNGEPMSQFKLTDWVEVTLRDGSTGIKNPKEALTNFVLDFELPKRYTQNL